MKRVIAFVLCLLVTLSLTATCFAGFDLSGLTFEELVALRDQINLAIWNSQEWQEVEVPQGVWEVGVDIPVGKWTIHAKPGATTYIKIGNETQNGGTEVKMKFAEVIWDTEAMLYQEGNVTEWTVELEAGQFLQVDNGIAVFSPYAGKPSLGFN